MEAWFLVTPTLRFKKGPGGFLTSFGMTTGRVTDDQGIDTLKGTKNVESLVIVSDPCRFGLQRLGRGGDDHPEDLLRFQEFAIHL